MDERVTYILKHPATLPTAVGVVSFGLGIGVGILIQKKRESMLNESKDDRYLDVEQNLGIDSGFDALREEIQAIQDQGPVGDTRLGIDTVAVMDADQYLAATRQVETLDDPEDDEMYDVGPDILEELQEFKPKTKDEEIQAIRENIFARSGDDWDYERELEVRTNHPLEPHVLHYDEFWENESEDMQHTLTYYSQDDILADEDNKPVFNHHEITGELMFGKGSKDNDTVYIRNPKYNAIYEVLRVNKMFSQEVMGLEIEDNARQQDLRHSSTPGKFRPDD